MGFVVGSSLLNELEQCQRILTTNEEPNVEKSKHNVLIYKII